MPTKATPDLPLAGSLSEVLGHDSAGHTSRAALASLFSGPELTGTPTAPTATAGTNTDQIATTSFVRGEVTALVNGAPGALDTLDELAAALGDDANYASTVTTALGNRLRIDASQGLNGTQQSQGRSNLALGTGATLNVPASGDAASGELVKGNDSRLSDARTPTTHTHTASQISDSTTTGRSVLTATDATAARTAISAQVSGSYAAATHTHAISDVTSLQTSLDAKAPLASPTFTGTVTVPDGASSGAAVNKGQLDLKANLASPTFTGTVVVPTASGSTSPVTKAQLDAVDATASAKSETLVAKGNATGAVSLDLSAALAFTATTTGATTWTFANPAASGMQGFTLVLTNGGSQTQTWPASVKWPSGTAPTLTSSGVDILSFITVDGGTTWRGLLAGADFR